MPTPSTVEISQGSRQGARSNLTPQQIMDQAYKLALQKGLGEDGARVLLAILQTEGGLTGLRGDLDIGGSAGPLQFYRDRGQLPNYAQARGLSQDQAMVKAETDPLDAIGWALDTYLGGAIRAGQKAGLQGPSLATYAQAKGQVSKTPERAGQNYSAMFSGQAAATQPAAAGGSRMAEPTTTTTSTATAEESAYLKRLREQKAQAEAAVKSAQLRRADLAKELAPRLQDGKIAEADYKAALAPIDAEITDARKQLTYVQDRIDDYEYQLDTERRKADTSSKPQTERERIDTERARLALQSDESALPYQQRKQQVDEERWRIALARDELGAYKDLLDLQVVQGNMDERAADRAFDRALNTATLGMRAEDAKAALLKQMAPQMGDKQLAQAAVTQLQGWRQHGATVPDFQLPVFTVNTEQDYGRWLPQPGQVQELWQRALAEGPGRQRQDEDMLSALEARANAVIAEQGGQGWDGAMAGSAAGLASGPPPLSDPTLGVHDYPPGPQRTAPASLPTSGGGVQDDYTSSFDWSDPRLQDMTDQARQRQQVAAKPSPVAGWDMRTGWPTPPQIGPQRPPARAAAPTADEELMEVERVLDENPSLSLDEAQNEARMRLQSRRTR